MAIFILSGWHSSNKLVCKTISHPRLRGKQAASLGRGLLRVQDRGTELHLSLDPHEERNGMTLGLGPASCQSLFPGAVMTWPGH